MPTSSDKKQTGIPQVGVVPGGLPSDVASFLLQLKRTVEFVRDGTKAHNTIIQSGAISGPATGIQPASVGSTGSGSGSGSGATFGINLYSKEQKLITQLDTEQYKDASVTGAKIAAGSLDAQHIAAGSITADTISVNKLSDLSAVLGQVEVTTAGYFYSGMTAYDTGTGWWMEYNSGNPRISFGDATGSHFTFDTTNGLQLYNSSNVLIFAVTAIDPNGKALIDFTQTGHTGKFLGNIPDDNSVGGRYAISVGLLAGRPAAGTAGRMYLATDAGTNGVKYRDTGTAWEVAGVGHLADILGTLDNVSDGSVNGRVKLSELTTGTVKQLNDGTTLRTAEEVGNVVGATADVNGNYLSAGSTSALLDDQGLGNTANWGNVANIPNTLTGHNLSGIAQPILPVTSGPKHIYASDSGGDIYEAPIYGSEINRYVADFMSSASLGPQAAWTQVGNTIVIPNPGQAVNLDVGVLVQVDQNSATTAFKIVGQIKISVDGGSTFTAYSDAYAYFPTTALDIRPLVAQSTVYAGTPTGDIWIEFGYSTIAGAGTFTLLNGSMQVMVSPLVNGSQQGGALSASILATAVDSCSVVYPGTTCRPAKALTVNAAGGVTPYTYSNAIVSGGTDGGATISSGATSQTFTIKGGSQTATSAGASYTAECHSVVTDSTLPTHLQVTTNTCVVTESYYLTYAAISASMSTTNGACNTGTVSGNCAANGLFSITASGGNGSYTYSNSITSQTTGYSATITAGATSASGTVGGTHATTILPGNTDTVQLQSVVNDTRSTGAFNATGSIGLTYKFIS